MEILALSRSMSRIPSKMLSISSLKTLSPLKTRNRRQPEPDLPQVQ